MKSTEKYLRELEDKLVDKLSIGNDWENDERFETLGERQKYNCGISEAMDLIREILDSDEFKSPLVKSLGF